MLHTLEHVGGAAGDRPTDLRSRYCFVRTSGWCPEPRIFSLMALIVSTRAVMKIYCRASLFSHVSHEEDTRITPLCVKAHDQFSRTFCFWMCKCFGGTGAATFRASFNELAFLSAAVSRPSWYVRFSPVMFGSLSAQSVYINRNTDTLVFWVFFLLTAKFSESLFIDLSTLLVLWLSAVIFISWCQSLNISGTFSFPVNIEKN